MTNAEKDFYQKLNGIFIKDFKLLLLIELNDSSHKEYNRKIRDIKVHEICNKEIKKSIIPIKNIEEK